MLILNKSNLKKKKKICHAEFIFVKYKPNVYKFNASQCFKHLHLFLRKFKFYNAQIFNL